VTPSWYALSGTEDENAMQTPIVIELPLKLEPVTRDDFIDPPARRRPAGGAGRGAARRP
jgi:hypothetical protein